MVVTLAFCGSANALLIAEYDLATGSAGTTKAATTVASGYSASSLALTNAASTGGALSSNHFYHKYKQKHCLCHFPIKNKKSP